MSDTFEDSMLKKAKELGTQQSNLEMNIQANSSATSDSMLDSDDPNVSGDTSWRDEETGEEIEDQQADPSVATEKPEDDVALTKGNS